MTRTKSKHSSAGLRFVYSKAKQKKQFKRQILFIYPEQKSTESGKKRKLCSYDIKILRVSVQKSHFGSRVDGSQLCWGEQPKLAGILVHQPCWHYLFSFCAEFSSLVVACCFMARYFVVAKNCVDVFARKPRRDGLMVVYINKEDDHENSHKIYRRFASHDCNIFRYFVCLRSGYWCLCSIGDVI